MKYWTWQIPALYVQYIVELGLESHPLYEELRATQYIEQGAPPQAYEIYPDVFLWRNHGHRMIYERMTKERTLLLASLERT